MRSATYASVAVIGVLAASPAGQLAVTLLTVPQRDALRSRGSPASVSISADGRYIAFASYARLTDADTDDRADIYVLDRVTGAATLQSVAAEGLPIESDCAHPRISNDGRYIVFETAIARENGSRIGVDILMRDRIGETTRRVSRSASGGPPDGRSSDPALSDDAGTIVFASTATDLVPEPDPNGAQSDIYAVHRATGVTRRISVDDRGMQPSTGASYAPSVSGDGRYVAFTSTADLDSTAIASDAAQLNGLQRPVSHIYLHDTTLNQTRRIAEKGRLPNGASMRPVISRDGRFVAFVSFATNLTTPDGNRSADVFLYERITGSITLVSRGITGRAANGTSVSPSISSDGRLVAFQSDASDLTCAVPCPPHAEDINLLSDVFVFDRLAGVIVRVSGGPERGWMEESAAPAVDATGHVIAFTSKHPIDVNDVDNDFDLFVRVSPAVR